MRLYTPVAHNGDRPITGPVRAEIIVDKKEFSHSIGDRNHIPYPMADAGDATATLTVRDRNDGPRRVLPRAEWKIVEGTHVAMQEGFEPGKIYELGLYGQGSCARGTRAGGDPRPDLVLQI